MRFLSPCVRFLSQCVRFLSNFERFSYIVSSFFLGSDE